MAVTHTKQSPGIYFSETDNTYYTNSTSAGNTTVAVIGYATKGPIGVPTEITSISNFKKTFGDYISGQYTGLAVTNIINAGGTILFVRVADSTTYSRSNVIVKNGVAAECGKLVMDSTDTIYVDNDGYTAGNVYTALLTDNDNNTTKVIVRSAAKSAIKQANLYKQLSSSLDTLYGFDEFKMGTMSDGVYGFSLTNVCGSNDVYGPYFVKTASSEDGSDLATKINDLINTSGDTKGYTSPFQKIYVYKNYGNPESTEEESSEEEPVPTTKDVFLGTDVAFSDDVLTNDKIKINYSFTKLGSTENTSIEFKKPTTGSLTFNAVASQLNSALEDAYSDQIHVKFVEGQTNSLGEVLTNSYFLFYSTGIEGEGNSFNFTNNTNITDYSTYMFMADNDTVTADSELRPAGTGTEIELTTYEYQPTNSFKGFIAQSFYTSSVAGADEVLTAEYNSTTDSIVVSFDSTTASSAEDTKIKVIEAGDVNTDSTKAFESFKCDFGLYLFDNVATEIARLNGSSASNLAIAKDSSTAQIYFYHDSETTVMDSPTIDNYTTEDGEYINSEYYGNLLNIDGVSFTEEDGTAEVKDSTKDMVIFTAKEYGSGTASDIQIEVETVTDSLTETETHNIYVYVDGSKAESFEDVSYDMKSDDYFVTLMNEDEDNGGSSYVTVKVIKNESGTTVNLPNSADKNDDGYYTLGEAPDSTHTTARTSDISEKSYTKYDFTVGDDGIDEGTDADELFIDAMDTEGSLANQDLYSFHVLITPDDINQDVQSAAIKLCESLGDAFYIADPPQGLTKKGVINWSNGKSESRTTALTSDFAAGYWPWLKVYDSVQAKNVWVMPSVVMAAKYAEVDNDSAAGPQYAPAGETNGTISAIDIEDYPNKTDRDDLYVSNRINPFVMYNDGTILAYGEKTFQRKNSTLTKIHTRRMLIQMKKEVKAALKSFIFLPTISSNLSTIKTYVTTILDKYKNNGGISSYTIDTSANTTETLQQDIYTLAVSVVPVGCLENIFVDFTLNKSEETVSAS